MSAAAAVRRRSRRPTQPVAVTSVPAVALLAWICPAHAGGCAPARPARPGVSNVGFVQGDAQACPLRQDSCDVMISSFGVMFFEDPAVAFAGIAAALGHGGRLAFLCWQHDIHNELFAIPLHAFGAHTQLPGPARPTICLSIRGRSAALAVQHRLGEHPDRPVSEPAWIGYDVADVMSYVSGMPMIRSLTADVGDEALTKRVLATIAEQYAARQRHDGVCGSCQPPGSSPPTAPDELICPASGGRCRGADLHAS